MCRLFGFRSVIKGQVHNSLLRADNALALQSGIHSDGWGVAYYIYGAPHLVKSEEAAINDVLFKKVSGIVSSQTVLAHIRKATTGNLNILNTHPFQYGHWVFAHNGNIKNFSQYRDKILQFIRKDLRCFILGETDSEIIFYHLLSRLNDDVCLSTKECSIETLARATQKMITELTSVVGPYCCNDSGSNEETYFTFIISNGPTMLAHQGGKNLYFSTYKTKCGDRETCPSFTEACESESKDGKINHLIFSSEPLSGENIWELLTPGQIIGVDERMQLYKSKTNC